MAHSCGLLAIGIVFFSSLAAASPAALRGIDPELRSRYDASNGKFDCLDGAKTISAVQLNDGYCDCFDGSDEPGTAACPNGRFFCRNLGSEPKVLNASFVDDGVCDCCDGSDEAPGACPKKCHVEGEAALASLRAELSEAESALRKRARYIKRAAGLRRDWESRLAEIKETEGAADAKAQAAAAKRDRLNGQLTKLETRMRTLEAALRPPPPPPQPAPELQEGQVEGGEGQPAADLQGGQEHPADAFPSSPSDDEDAMPYDDEDGHRLDDYAAAEDSAPAGAGGEPQHEETQEELARRVASQWIPGAAEPKLAEEQQQEEEKADGGDDDMGEESSEAYAPEEGEEEEEREGDGADTPPDAGTTAEPGMELGDAELGFVGTIKAWATGVVARVMRRAPDVRELEQLRVAVAALRKRTDAARDAASSAQTTANNLRSEKATLEEKVGRTYGPEDAYAQLADRCVETKVDKYTYKVCPFSKAEQLEGAMHVGLGTWGGFDDAGDHMKFEKGMGCWNGPSRSMTVRVRCGNAEALSRVAEPSRCEYAAEMTTPAACTEAQVQALRDALAAKHAFVHGVRDEL